MGSASFHGLEDQPIANLLVEGRGYRVEGNLLFSTTHLSTLAFGAKPKLILVYPRTKKVAPFAGQKWHNL